MITELTLTNFKCFEKETKFEFAKLNLLTGINGRGKSSVLQSLLLLSQTLRNSNSPEKLLINGEWIELGTFEDIKCSHSGSKEIIIEIKTNDKEQNNLLFVYEEYGNGRIGNLTDLRIDNEGKFQENTTESDTTSKSTKNNSKKSLLPLGPLNNSSFLHKFHYISADRLGPIEYVKKSGFPDSLKLGIRGENFINILANYGEILNVSMPLCKNLSNHSLIIQTTNWLSYIFDGANVEILGKENSSSILSLLLNSQNVESGKTYKAPNVGFGYSYVLPIVVAGLIAKKDDTLVIENPEAHLHPRAQSRIAEYLARIAATGIQVFVESHSEHILNGIRLCVLNPDITFNNQDISIYYFDENYNSELLQINENGKVNNWPSGFFDQQEIDLAEIFKFGHKH